MIEVFPIPQRGKKRQLPSYGALRCPFRALIVWGSIFYGFVVSGNTLEVVKKIPHSGYSEGLTFYQGFLWHALPKKLLKIDPADGHVVAEYPPATDYSESLEWFQGKLFNVSFSNNGLFSARLEKGGFAFKKMGEVPEVHAWGLTHNGTELVVTGDFSSKLYFIDPKTFKVKRTLETEIKDIEDLAWDGKVFWTSSFTQDRGHIYAIDPKTGKKLGMFGMPAQDPCPVIDGIAVEGAFLWLTGKECPSLWKVKKPNLTQEKPPSAVQKKL